MAQATIWNPNTGQKQVITAGGAMPTGFSLWTGGNASGAQAQAAIAKPAIPNGAVAINGAQYNTRELQQGAFDNIRPINGTLYGTPKVPSKINATDLNGDAKAQLDTLVANNAQKQAQDYTDNRNQASADAVTGFQDFAKGYFEAGLDTPEITQMREDRNKIQDQLTAKTNEQNTYNLDTQKQQSAEDFNNNKLSSQIGKSQAQIARERSFGSQDLGLQVANLTAQETNMLNRLNIAKQDRKDIQAGLLSTYQVQQKMQEAVANNAKEVYAVARQLTQDQQKTASDILTSLAGVDPSKLTGDMRSQLTEMFIQANIPQSLGFAMLQQAFDSNTIKTNQENDTKMISAGYKYISTPAERDALKKQGADIQVLNGRTYASAVPVAPVSSGGGSRSSSGSGSSSVGSASSAQTKFTPTEIKKLEQAGLSNAERQTQLDYLYGKKTGTETASSDKEVAQATAASEQAKRQVSLIDELLANNDGIAGAVGPSFLTRWNISNFVTGKEGDLVAGVEQLISQGTMEALLNLKKAGGTLGALSDGEKTMLTSSFSKLGTWAIRNKSGQVTGYKTTEKAFRKELESIRTLTEKAINNAGTESNLSDADAYNLYINSQ